MRTSGGKVNTCRRLLKPPTSSQEDDLPNTRALSILSTYDVENSIEQVSLKSFPCIRNKIFRREWFSLDLELITLEPTKKQWYKNLIGLSQLVSNLRRRIQELDKQRAWTSGMVTCHTGQGCPFWQLLLTLYVWVMWHFELAYMTMNEPKSVHLWPRYNLFHIDRFRFRVVCWQALHLWQAKRGPRENERVSGEAARDGGKESL